VKSETGRGVWSGESIRGCRTKETSETIVVTWRLRSEGGDIAAIVRTTRTSAADARLELVSESIVRMELRASGVSEMPRLSAARMDFRSLPRGDTKKLARDFERPVAGLDVAARRSSTWKRVSNGDSNVADKIRAREIGQKVASFLRSPWAAPVFLLPFLVKLAVHQLLGLSDALLAADNPGERPAHGYNLLMGINMNLCPIAAVLHFIDSQRAFPWIMIRLLIPTLLFFLGIMTL
jgi:hypothetical protein